MSSKQIWALVLIGLCAVVLVLNSRGSISVNLIVTSVAAAKPLVLLAFISVGVLIGILFK